MEEIELKIGREESGKQAITVPQTYNKVSRHHAKLLWKDGAMTIEDNESANGTFVNGKRIAKTKVTGNDMVWLGGKNDDEGGYQLDMQRVLAIILEARTDFSKEFEDIKQAYLDYKREEAELEKKAAIKTQLPRIIPTIFMGVITLILLFFAPLKYKMVAGTLGGVVTTLIGLLTIGKNATIKEKTSEEIIELQLKYQPRYCCPKCCMKYPFTMHWKKLLTDGKCPNPKCNAKFVKE